MNILLKHVRKVLNILSTLLIIISYLYFPLKEFVLTSVLVLLLFLMIQNWGHKSFLLGMNRILFDIYYLKTKLKEKDLYDPVDYSVKYKEWYSNLSELGKEEIKSQSHKWFIK